MKKIFRIIIVAAFALMGMTSCLYDESIDCFAEWGFAEDTESDVIYGLETMLPAAQKIITTFDNCFSSEYDDCLGGHEVVMRQQHGRSQAYKNAKKTAERAASMIEDGFTCPLDNIFVVRVQYEAGGEYKTVWSHDYRI